MGDGAGAEGVLWLRREEARAVLSREDVPRKRSATMKSIRHGVSSQG